MAKVDAAGGVLGSCPGFDLGRPLGSRRDEALADGGWRKNGELGAVELPAVYSKTAIWPLCSKGGQPGAVPTFVRWQGSGVGEKNVGRVGSTGRAHRNDPPERLECAGRQRRRDEVPRATRGEEEDGRAGGRRGRMSRVSMVVADARIPPDEICEATRNVA